MVSPSPLSVAESAGMPSTVKSPESIEAGSIGSSNVKEKAVGAAPVTTEPGAGLLEITVGTISKWEIQVAQLAGKPARSAVAYSAPPQNVPGADGSTAMPL